MFCCTVSKNGSGSFNESRITRELRYTSTMCSSSVSVSSFTISWKFTLFAAFICNAVNCAHKAGRKKKCSETFKSNMYDTDHIPQHPHCSQVEMGGGLLMSNINQPGNQSRTKILFRKIGSGGKTTHSGP